MLYKAVVTTTLKPEYPDSHGRALEGALRAHGFTGVLGVRLGREIEVEVEAEPHEINDKVDQMAKKLLAHPVVDNYTFKIRPLKEDEPRQPKQVKHTFDPTTLIQGYDLSDHNFKFGKFKIVRVEWKEKLPWCVVLRYTRNDKLEPLGLRLDLDKRTILDDLSVKRSDQAMKKKVLKIWDAVITGLQEAGALPLELDERF